MKKKVACLIIIVIAVTGYLLPEHMNIPVKQATQADWNHNTFWHPWGKSRVHKGIDIFAKEGTPVITSCFGIVIYAGHLSEGGNVVLVLGPKWRFHYYAHLKTIEVSIGDMISAKQEIGTVGKTGNAAGKPPHLHYSILSIIPDIHNFEFNRYGFVKMFYVNPHEMLVKK